jgi:YfiH family protein
VTAGGIVPPPPTGATITLPAGARARFTGVAQGDLGHGGRVVKEVAPHVSARRRAVCNLPWTWLRQVHGARVVEVHAAGDGAGERADASVSARRGCALAILTADCAPVALVADEGVIGAAHVGWRGLLAGIIDTTTAAMRALGGQRLHALIGPCIRAECYEFGADELQHVCRLLGPSVAARTSDGKPALDLPAAVRAALLAAGVDDVDEVGACTSCTPGYFSHRARADVGRQALVLWR